MQFLFYPSFWLALWLAPLNHRPEAKSNAEEAKDR